MTAPSSVGLNRPIRREAAKHLFTVGQAVRLKGGFGTRPEFGDIYRITGTLPPRENSPQYRVRNDDELHDRVTTEDSLEPVVMAQPIDGTTLIERTFGEGQGKKAQQSRDSKAEAGESPPKPEIAFGHQIKLAAKANAPHNKGKS